MGTLLTLPLSIGLQDTLAQERQYPRLEDEHYIEVKPGNEYNCLGCKIVFKGTEFTVWERPEGDRVVIVGGPITDNATFFNDSFLYNYYFSGLKHYIEDPCDDSDYEQYKVR
jgi:hypothetical protein